MQLLPLISGKQRRPKHGTAILSARSPNWLQLLGTRAPTIAPLTLVPPPRKGLAPQARAQRTPSTRPLASWILRPQRFLFRSDLTFMVMPGPRRPPKHQIHLHLGGHKRHRHRHGHPRPGPRPPLRGRRRRETAGPPEADAGLAWPRHRTPRHPPARPARQLRVPIVGTRRSFPAPTMTPFLSKKKLTTSRAGRASALPASEGPARPGPLPTSRPEAGTDRPTGRADPVGRPRGQGTGGEAGGGSATPRSPGRRRGPRRPRERGRQAGATAGGAGAPQAEAKGSGARRAHRGDPPARWRGPGTPRRTPRRARGRLRNALPSSEASAEPSASRVPSPAPPQNQQARGRDGETRGASSGAEAEAPAPPPPAAATGTFVWRPLGFPRWGEGDDEKPSRTGARAPVALPPRGRRPQTLLRLAPGRGPGGGRGGGQLSFRDSSAPAPKLLTPDSTDGQTSLPPPEPPRFPPLSTPLSCLPSPTSFPDGL